MLDLDQAGRGLRDAVTFAVPGDLRGLVEGAWLRQGRAGPERHDPTRDPGPSALPGPDVVRGWRVVADPSPHVIVKRDRSGRVHMRVVGARTRWIDVDPRREFTLAVRLRPGALPLLAGIPATDLVDRSVALDLVLERALVDPVEEAAGLGSPDLILEPLFAALRSRARRTGDVKVDWRVRGLLRLEPGGQVGEIASRMGVSDRSLRERVGSAVGMPPVRVLRIRRLHRALLAGLREHLESWSKVAHVAGYHDQAHFIRDCRALLGETPVTFAARRGRARPADARRFVQSGGGERRTVWGGTMPPDREIP